MAPSQNRHFPRISLVEALIAALLTGFLFTLGAPFLASLREDADRAVCRSNLRAIGQAVLAYENERGHLPGPSRRAVQSPLTPHRPGSTISPDYWDSMNVCLSVRLEGYFGPLSPADPGPFSCPANRGTFTDPRNPVFLLMRNIRTNPPSFFGDMDFGRRPICLSEIISAGSSPRGRAATNLSQIWMISDIDTGNYRTTGTAAPVPFGPPHSGGRNYVFFDGRLEYVTPNSDGYWTYPANSGDIGNDM